MLFCQNVAKCLKITSHSWDLNRRCFFPISSGLKIFHTFQTDIKMKEIIHPTMKILSLFTHPCVILNPWAVIFSKHILIISNRSLEEHKGEIMDGCHFLCNLKNERNEKSIGYLLIFCLNLLLIFFLVRTRTHYIHMLRINRFPNFLQNVVSNVHLSIEYISNIYCLFCYSW